MSDLIPLARLLEHHDRTVPYPDEYVVLAARLVADPALLDALAAAGVLHDLSRLRTEVVYDGDRPVDRVLVTERRYESGWRREP